MPPFALFEFVVSLLRGASQSNNAKSGTGVVEAPMRISLHVADVQTRVSLQVLPC